MRRLRSSFTLLSNDESPPRPEELYNRSPEQQFTWDELFSSAEATASFSAIPSPEYFQASPYPEYPSDGLYHAGGQFSPKFVQPPYGGDGIEADDIYLPEDLPSEEQRQPQQLTVTPYGTVSVLLRHLVRVDVSPGGAVMVRNCRSGATAAVGAASERACIVHVNARVYRDGREAYVMTCQGRLAKICQRGVVFAASTRSLAYLVDESGTKSTADRFVDLRRDLSMDVFSDCGEGASAAECYALLATSVYKPLPNGDDVWCIGGGTQLKQDRYGNVEVCQGSRRIALQPTVDELSLHTGSEFSATVGSYSKRYLSVEMGPRRITAGYCGLTAKSGSQRAGIDRTGKVSIL